MRFLLLFITVFGFLSASQCEDNEVISGVLDNGLRYYVRHNERPEKQAYVELIVKVGSGFERADELGYAHFVEHMAYRGTENFKDGEVKRYFDTLGSWHDPDTNGETSYDSTKYHFSIPLDNSEALQKTLFILSEFAGFAKFQDEVLEKEKGVVIDELHRFFSDVVIKAKMQVIKSFARGTTYEARIPAGTEKSIRDATSASLHQFYDKWYTPDRMAIVVVGDCDPKSCIEFIHECFGRIPPSKKESFEPELHFEFPKQPESLIYVDPELTDSVLGLFSFVKAEPIETPEDLFLHNVIEQLYFRKLSEIEEQYSDLLSVDLIEEQLGFDWTLKGYTANFDGNSKNTAQVMSRELKKIASNGFTKVELILAKIDLEKDLEEELDLIDEITHEDLVEKIENHFLHGHAILSPKACLEFQLEALNRISLKDIQEKAASYMMGPFHVLLTVPQAPSDLNEENLLRIFADNDVSDVEISSTNHANKFDVKTWELSNGIRVSLRPSQDEKKKVLISASALGGTSSLDTPEEFMTAQVLLSYLRRSGTFDLLNSHPDVKFQAALNHDSRSVLAVGNKKELEVLFESIHAFFSAPSFVPMSWDYLIKGIQENKIQDLKDPEFKFKKHLEMLYSNENFHLLDFDANDAHETLAKPLFHRFFGSPRVFHFAICGDFSFEEVEPLVRKYLGTLHSEEPVDLPSSDVICIPFEPIYSRFHAGTSTHPKTVIGYVYSAKNMIPDPKASNAIDLLNYILERRLTYALREDLGQTYNVSISRFGPKDTSSRNTVLEIIFTGQENHQEQMITRVKQTVENLIRDGISEEELMSAKQSHRQGYKRLIKNNFYWAIMLHKAHIHSHSYDALFDYESILANIHTTDMQEIIQKVFSGSPPIITCLLPEKTKNDQ